ncbi:MULTISPECIES: DUF3397 domain-containing protein [Paenibacillus]|uniref:DUF3397 domain-containing protein n=1 Tax=Paenibacillus TaxID=44249 RepID=UPI0022B8FFCE|nr:DUF3397 domain-containing protein [Paenibacillus caseinilyticus]MCZ8518757.1 DUF3397 domain-containing protein [Paenibacillus caseinilyticus]
MVVLLQWLQQLYLFLALVPFAAFLLTWGAVYGITRDKRKATHYSMDITSVFLIGSVAVMSRNIFGSGMLGWTVVLVFLVAAGLLGNMQNRKRGKVDLVRIARTLGRLGFVFLSACYVLLLLVGIGKYMII